MKYFLLCICLCCFMFSYGNMQSNGPFDEKERVLQLTNVKTNQRFHLHPGEIVKVTYLFKGEFKFRKGTIDGFSTAGDILYLTLKSGENISVPIDSIRKIKQKRGSNNPVLKLLLKILVFVLGLFGLLFTLVWAAVGGVGAAIVGLLATIGIFVGFGILVRRNKARFNLKKKFKPEVVELSPNAP